MNGTRAARMVLGKTMPLGAPSARHAARADRDGMVGEGEGEPMTVPWEGSCPECGGLAVYREVRSGTVVGACCAGEGCWWVSPFSDDYSQSVRSEPLF